MRRYLIGILLAVVLVLDLGGIRENDTQSMAGIAQGGSNTNVTNEEQQLGVGDANRDSLFTTFVMTIGEVPVSLFTSRGGGMNFPRNLRSVSTIRILSSQNTPILEKGTKNQYFHYHFTEASYRYFVYTLRRILI